jgi:hypothetical protein
MQRACACQAKPAQKGEDENIVIAAVGLKDFMSKLRFDRLCAPMCAPISIQTAGVPVIGIPTATPKETLAPPLPYGYTATHALVARKHLSPTSKANKRHR